MSTIALSPIGHELLDDPAADPATRHRILPRTSCAATGWFGGAAAVRFGLRAADLGRARRAALDQPARHRHRGGRPAAARGRLGPAARCTAARRRASSAAGSRPRIASAPGCRRVVGCAGALPFARAQRRPRPDEPAASTTSSRDAAVDVHPGSEPCRASSASIVADLRRSALAAIGFRIGAEVLGFDAATKARWRHLGPARVPCRMSSSRSSADAGVSATVHRRPGYRLVAAWRTA